MDWALFSSPEPQLLRPNPAENLGFEQFEPLSSADEDNYSDASSSDLDDRFPSGSEPAQASIVYYNNTAQSAQRAQSLGPPRVAVEQSLSSSEKTDQTQAQSQLHALLSRLPPPGMLEEEWRRMVAAAIALRAGWGDTLLAQGWTELEIYGLDARAPTARFDDAGLVRLLLDREVVAVTAETIALRTRSGAAQTFRRPLDQAGAVLLWDLPAGEARYHVEPERQGAA